MMTDVKINAGINANERIDDLCRDNLRLIQNTDVFCFGMDAVLLSTFAKAGKNQNTFLIMAADTVCCKPNNASNAISANVLFIIYRN